MRTVVQYLADAAEQGLQDKPMTTTTDAVHARHRYIRAVLELYTSTPGVLGRIRRADRLLAGELFDRNIPLYIVDYACVLAAARRTFRNAFTAPLPPIRSLHYLLPLVQEVIERPPGYREVSQMRERLAETYRLR